MKANYFVLSPGNLILDDINLLQVAPTKLKLSESALSAILLSANAVSNALAKGKTVYGINTGFGKLADTKISAGNLQQLQRNLVLSHCTGTGPLLEDEIVKLIMLLKINSLARGYSGVRVVVIESLIALYNAEVYPCIPSKGSVGASGDLAPLAHLSLVLLGEGEVRHQGKIISAKKGLAKAKIKPVELQPKEGLALLNGTQVSTALALSAYTKAAQIFSVAIYAGALSTRAVRGNVSPFDERIHAIRNHPGQIRAGKLLRELLSGGVTPVRLQDPYSIRCQPQVMGACLDQMDFARDVLLREANAVSDNPLVFSESEEIISGGNFHAEPVAFAADNLALAIAEIGAIAERRIALLTDQHNSGLPAFLINDSGLNSGFMIAHVTASALASENKSLAHPASVDSLPTSANQEDHVSMATFAARRLHAMLDNTATIIAIELMCASQGLGLLKPVSLSLPLEKIMTEIKKIAPFREQDRVFTAEIEQMKNLVLRYKIAPE